MGLQVGVQADAGAEATDINAITQGIVQVIPKAQQPDSRA